MGRSMSGQVVDDDERVLAAITEIFATWGNMGSAADMSVP